MLIAYTLRPGLGLLSVGLSGVCDHGRTARRPSSQQYQVLTSFSFPWRENILFCCAVFCCRGSDRGGGAGVGWKDGGAAATQVYDPTFSFICYIQDLSWASLRSLKVFLYVNTMLLIA